MSEPNILLPNRYIQIDHICRSTIPQRVLHVIALEIDIYAIRIGYLITPPLPGPGVNGNPPIGWRWHAMDDLGNEYVEAGGAYGRTPEQGSTAGVLSLTPLPPPEARSLKVVLNPWFEADAFESDSEETPCVFDVDLSQLWA